MHADLDWRVARVSADLLKSSKEARDMVQKTDKSRSSYYNYYTNKKWGAAESYCMTVDSSKLGSEGATKAIIQAVEIFDALKESKK